MFTLLQNCHPAVPPPTDLSMPEDMSPFTFGPDPFLVNRPRQLYGNMINYIECRPCHNRFNITTHHRHHSTYYFHKTSEYLGSTSVNCPTCKVHHPIQQERDRTVVLYTSSTLHNTYLQPEVRWPFHIDVESICGAKLYDLYQAWTATYRLEPGPVDLIIVAGLNDVRTTSVQDFTNTLNHWYFTLKDNNDSSTMRICKLMRPPSLAWFPANGPQPDLPYTNHLDKINLINSQIDHFNRLNSIDQVIGFSNEGCRAGKKRHRGGAPAISHVLHQWREADQGMASCLHLRDKERANMTRKLARYIQHYML